MNGSGWQKLQSELREFVEEWDSLSTLSFDEYINYINRKYISRKQTQGEWVIFSSFTNHELCHWMFWNAMNGGSELYIQIPIPEDDDLSHIYSEDDGTIVLPCSLLTRQMLDYDAMMFQAMSDEQNDWEYKRAAQQHYRPYLFGYVMEVDRESYEILKRLQRDIMEREERPLTEENDPSPYLWMRCTFADAPGSKTVKLSGYVVQSASRARKIKKDLFILENEKTPAKLKKKILDSYTISEKRHVTDKIFIDQIKKNLDSVPVDAVEVYKVGNGNCVFAHMNGSDAGFFYDIGFNYRHLPKMIAPGVTYSYWKTIDAVIKNKPSFFILSHWDMDHIAGCYAARKDFLGKDWFAPNCDDACTNAIRLAKYLDLVGHLYLVSRSSARQIGADIEIAAPSGKRIATYRLYMGGKAPCDTSKRNCEGIVIEYTNEIQGKTLLMMGDVNYASFNLARDAAGLPLFADMQIDCLIAPHHGSQHTAYEQITDHDRIVKKGEMAAICCDDKSKDRPNPDHRDELKKRFDVCTTEHPPVSTDVSITIHI